MLNIVKLRAGFMIVKPSHRNKTNKNMLLYTANEVQCKIYKTILKTIVFPKDPFLQKSYGIFNYIFY